MQIKLTPCTLFAEGNNVVFAPNWSPVDRLLAQGRRHEPAGHHDGELQRAHSGVRDRGRRRLSRLDLRRRRRRQRRRVGDHGCARTNDRARLPQPVRRRRVPLLAVRDQHRHHVRPGRSRRLLGLRGALQVDCRGSTCAEHAAIGCAARQLLHDARRQRRARDLPPRCASWFAVRAPSQKTRTPGGRRAAQCRAA